MKYKIAGNILSQIVDDKMIFFNSENSIIFSLNETATVMIKQMKKGSSAENIASYIAKKYEVNYSQVLKDTMSFINKLLAKKVIVAR